MKRSHSEIVESGVIETFLEDKGFGFVRLDKPCSRKLFFHLVELMKAGRDTTTVGTRVKIHRWFDPKKGKPAVYCFLEFDGIAVTDTGSYTFVDGHFVFHGTKPKKETKELRPDPTPPAAVTKPNGVQKSNGSTAVLPQVVKPRIDSASWIEIGLKKVRREHMSYATSDLGSIKVPWEILQKAKITSVRARERFEARCEGGEDLPVVIEIRRY